MSDLTYMSTERGLDYEHPAWKLFEKSKKPTEKVPNEFSLFAKTVNAGKAELQLLNHARFQAFFSFRQALQAAIRRNGLYKLRILADVFQIQ